MDILLNIKNCIKKSRYNQKEVAEILGISEDSLVNYLKGKTQFKLNQLVHIAEILEVSLCYLLTEKEAENITKEEQEIINAYRRQDEGTRRTICKILDVEREEQERSSECRTG